MGKTGKSKCFRMEYHACEPCDKHFNGIRPYRDHLASERHKRKMRQIQTAPPVISPRSTQVPSDQSLDPFIMPQGKGCWCSLCNLELNEPDQVKTHVAGSKHLELKLDHSGNSEKDIGAEKS